MFNEVANSTHIDKNKTYTFVFNVWERSGTSAARPTMTVDWSVMPDQPYNVYFNYIGEVNNIDGTLIPSVYANFLNGSFYQAVSPAQRTQSVSTTLLGLLRYEFIGNNSFIYADYKTNPPVYISGRPTQNIGRFFDITQNAVSPTSGTYAPILNDLAPFVLTMLFVPCPPDV